VRLVTERLILRRWEGRDRAPFAALNADVIDPALEAGESDALVAFFEQRWESDGFAFAAAERRADGAFVGMIGLQRFEGPEPIGACVEIGWRLPRAFWGRGYATEAARAWLGHGIGTLGLGEVVAFTEPENRRSLAVMERLGMRREPARDFVHPELPEAGPLAVCVARAEAGSGA
jgi:RimJ/RimL family protein N-acetyltransferase